MHKDFKTIVVAVACTTLGVFGSSFAKEVIESFKKEKTYSLTFSEPMSRIYLSPELIKMANDNSKISKMGFAIHPIRVDNFDSDIVEKSFSIPVCNAYYSKSITVPNNLPESNVSYSKDISQVTVHYKYFPSNSYHQFYIVTDINCNWSLNFKALSPNIKAVMWSSDKSEGEEDNWLSIFFSNSTYVMLSLIAVGMFGVYLGEKKQTGINKEGSTKNN